MGSSSGSSSQFLAFSSDRPTLSKRKENKPEEGRKGDWRGDGCAACSTSILVYDANDDGGGGGATYPIAIVAAAAHYDDCAAHDVMERRKEGRKEGGK